VSETQFERVLVVPTELFRRIGYFQGFSGDVGRYLDTLLRPEHTSYRPRAEVEKDPGFKQLIPYMIFRHTDAAGSQTVFQYTRGVGMGEGRLHRKRSVGIGGHISAIDAAADGAGNPYEEGMRREMDEEVAIDAPYTAGCVGMINDDQTEVGRVHLGIVHLFDVQRPAVRPRETEIIECGFRPVEAILADMTGFETWSQICMTALFGAKSG
jgi:predicted NUDIX family phosphoesterase